MMQRSFRIVAFAWMFTLFYLAGSAFGQESAQPKKEEKGESRLEKFSTDCSGGFYVLPGFLLDRHLVRHPSHLSGPFVSCNLKYKFTDHWLLGFEFAQVVAQGSGEWARRDTQQRLEREHVTGITTGTTEIRMRMIMLSVERQFTHSRFQPYLKFNAGVGLVRSVFDGRFTGHETKSGFSFPINEPAHNLDRFLIPVFALEGGMRIQLGKGFSFAGAPFWNTGWGTRVNLTYDLSQISRGRRKHNVNSQGTRAVP